MPYKSKAQQRFMYAAEARGDVPKGTAERWQQHTKNKNLPEHVKKAAARWRVNREIEKTAGWPIYSKASADSAWAATKPLADSVANKFELANDAVRAATGSGVEHQVPSAGIGKTFLGKSLENISTTPIEGKTLVSKEDSISMAKAHKYYGKGETGLRKINNSNIGWATIQSVPFATKQLLNKPAVDKGLNTAKKYFPTEYKNYSDYVKNKTGMGWGGDTSKTVDSTVAPMSAPQQSKVPSQPKSK